MLHFQCLNNKLLTKKFYVHSKKFEAQNVQNNHFSISPYLARGIQLVLNTQQLEILTWPEE